PAVLVVVSKDVINRVPRYLVLRGGRVLLLWAATYRCANDVGYSVFESHHESVWGNVLISECHAVFLSSVVNSSTRAMYSAITVRSRLAAGGGTSSRARNHANRCTVKS